jgi:UDP-GlcNAc:undecaprenyl-phosphate GlcNAc-1-phosphate transferase
MSTFFFTYLLSLFMAAAVTPVVILAGGKLKAYDRPDIRKIHVGSIPRIGGVAIFVSSMCAIMTMLFFYDVMAERFRIGLLQNAAMLFAATFIMLVGFVDDIRNVRVRYKLLAQIAAAVLMYLVGVRIESVNVANLFTLRFTMTSLPLTVLWIVGMTNTVNLTDGLDGLAAGICIVACAVITVFAVVHHEALLAVIMLAVMGSLSGFLLFNFNPARIFMGDSGSMFLGFIIAAASVMCLMKSGSIVALALPAVALGLPIFDTAYAILRRYLERRPITSPDREHLHHRLLDMGLRHRHAVIVIYAVTVLAAAMGMFMMITDGYATIVVFACILVLLAIAYQVAGSVRLREIIVRLQARQTAIRQAGEDAHQFENLQLHFRNARTFDQWWRVVCLAGDKLHAEKLSLEFIAPDSRRKKLLWRRDSDNITPSPPGDIVNAKVPTRNDCAPSAICLNIEIKANGSIESAGRKIALFTRLMEEHSTTPPQNSCEI